MKYYYGKTRKNEGFMMIFGLVIAGLSLYSGITQLGTSKSFVFIICGLLFLTVTFYKTIQVITGEGADEIGSFFGMKRHNMWKWEECDYMFGNYKKVAPDVMVTIRRGNKNRNYILERRAVPQIFDWAAKANPNIKIEYYGVGEEEFDDTEIAKNKAKNGRTESVELRHVAEELKKTGRAAYKKPEPGRMKFKKPDRKLKSVR